MRAGNEGGGFRAWSERPAGRLTEMGIAEAGSSVARTNVQVKGKKSVVGFFSEFADTALSSGQVLAGPHQFGLTVVPAAHVEMRRVTSLS